MPYEIRYDSDIDCVILQAEAKVTMDWIRKVAPKVTAACNKNGCQKLLNDMTKCSIDVSVLDMYTSPRIIEASGLGTIKRALVVPESFKRSNFLKNSTIRKGHHFMIFIDREEARKWLLLEQ